MWLCIYYCELFLIQIYVMFQQPDLVEPIIKRFNKLVKDKYRKVMSQQALPHDLSVQETTRYFDSLLLSAKVRLKVFWDVEGCTRSLFKAYHLHRNFINGIDRKGADDMSSRWYCIMIECCVCSSRLTQAHEYCIKLHQL